MYVCVYLGGCWPSMELIGIKVDVGFVGGGGVVGVLQREVGSRAGCVVAHFFFLPCIHHYYYYQ